MQFERVSDGKVSLRGKENLEKAERRKGRTGGVLQRKGIL